MRFLVLAVITCLLGTQLAAEQLFGRDVVITDARHDRGARAPLVIVMHGFLGTPEEIRRSSGFDRVARANGLVVVYPSGLRRRWNDGRSPANETYDVGFLTQLVSSFVSDGRADLSQVYAVGHSNGGGMAMRLACDRPNLLAGIAVVATKVPSAYTCPQGLPVPAIFIHGTLDPIAPHVGRPGGARLGATMSAADGMATWQQRNRCGASRVVQTIDTQNDGTAVQVIDYAGCTAALRYLLIEGHGHGWPRQRARATRLLGPATQELDASSAIWQFFGQL
ncbi:polyhydroxybutyrate depolymerase [Octadecabacter temperatus]|uniref:Alpha/beta hydrolase family protein n=1 Tax=Octadecabacter temperatus TaxID=1458307 RepID=A0A0K0Y802_9RHOB|nr:PHB depolymerase family esterase [Octadecabacter temperatus]AKS47093.1 Alpha/beta hydrolase family protein [Octadecabacter temperatus]SIO46575.1 polyhydroxybutyrate depolymerase [Octadecabacter temperatus]